MKAKIFISGRITKGETLVDVISQFKRFEEPSEVVVEIKSNGGNKDEGEAVYDYLKNLDAEIPVTTKTGKAYSIAAKIFAAGSTRIVEDADKALMIHFARAKNVEGTAEQLEEVAAELRVIEDEFAEFYSEHLSIDETTVRNLLDNETFVSGKEAVELGFATEVEKAAEIVAELNIEKTNISTMTQKKKDKNFFKKLVADIQAYLEEDKPEVVAELTLQDSTGTEIVFPDLETDATPKVGDAAQIDGAAIPDGSYIMPSLEDATVVFADGKVSEIIPKEDEEETDAEVEARFDKYKKGVEVLAETEGLEISTWSMRLVNDTFAVGDILKHYGWEDEECIVATAEVKIPDGRTVVTDASGQIVLIKEKADETIIPETETETEANFEALLVKVKDKVKLELTAEHEAELNAKDDEIKALKKKIGSKEISAEERETEAGEQPVKKSLADIFRTK